MRDIGAQEIPTSLLVIEKSRIASFLYIRRGILHSSGTEGMYLSRREQMARLNPEVI